MNVVAHHFFDIRRGIAFYMGAPKAGQSELQCGACKVTIAGSYVRRS